MIPLGRNKNVCETSRETYIAIHEEKQQLWYFPIDREKLRIMRVISVGLFSIDERGWGSGMVGVASYITDNYISRKRQPRPRTAMTV